MPLAGVEETLTITGESPVVDVKNTNIGTSFTKELMEDIPNARDIWAAMAQAPGFQMQSYDVGGSHTGTQTGFSTYGFSGQNKTLLEGINVTEATDANAGYFDFGSFEEFSIGGAGNMGEQTGPGAFLNLTIKSGGDDFSASVYYDYENDDTVGDNVPDEFRTGGGVGRFEAPIQRRPASGLSAGNPITKQYDFNVNGGGPIVKGKAWFFGSYRDNNQYKLILGLPDTAQSQLKNYTLKGTYQLNTRNQIIGFFNQRTKLQPLRDLSLTTPTETAHWQSSKNRPWKVEWTSTPSNELFLDFQFAHWGNYFPLYPSATQSTSTEGVPVGRIDLATNQRSGARSYYHDRTTLKPQFSGSALLFQGRLGRKPQLQIRDRDPEGTAIVPALRAGEPLLLGQSGGSSGGLDLQHAQRGNRRHHGGRVLRAGRLDRQQPPYAEPRPAIRQLRNQLSGAELHSRAGWLSSRRSRPARRISCPSRRLARGSVSPTT